MLKEAEALCNQFRFYQSRRLHESYPGNRFPSSVASVHERVNILGVGITVRNMETALQKIEAFLDAGGSVATSASRGAQGIIEAQKDKDFRNILNSAFLP